MSHFRLLPLFILLAVAGCDRVKNLVNLKGSEDTEEGSSAKGESMPQAANVKSSLPVSTKFHSVSSAGFQPFIAKSDRIAVVEFYADW